MSGSKETFFTYVAPWLLYAGGAFVGHVTWGIWAACLLLGVMILRQPLKAKAVEIVLLLFFFLLLIGVAWLQLPWLIASQNWLAPALLAGMAWGSLLIGSPFTLAFARETTPRSMWKNPHFYLVNRILTALWGSAFLTCTLIKCGNWMPQWASFSISLGLMCAVLGFTKWFPVWYRREIFLKDPTVSASEKINS
jgi:hypothetical protein